MGAARAVADADRYLRAGRKPHDGAIPDVAVWLAGEVKAGHLEPEPTTEQLAAVAGILLDAEVVANRA